MDREQQWWRPVPGAVRLELCPCPECGMPAEVVPAEGNRVGRDELVGVRCVERHWFFGLRERLVA